MAEVPGSDSQRTNLAFSNGDRQLAGIAGIAEKAWANSLKGIAHVNPSSDAKIDPV